MDKSRHWNFEQAERVSMDVLVTGNWALLQNLQEIIPSRRFPKFSVFENFDCLFFMNLLHRSAEQSVVGEMSDFVADGTILQTTMRHSVASPDSRKHYKTKNDSTLPKYQHFLQKKLISVDSVTLLHGLAMWDFPKWLIL